MTQSLHASPQSTPVLLLFFNRPSNTHAVFEAIAKARPARLYLASDGPRNEAERDIVEELRKNAIAAVNWPCEVKTLFRSKNLGCRVAVSSAIDWFFENEEAGIILEDDCLPNISFFKFCEEMIQKYSNDTSIWSISGDCFPKDSLIGEYSYFFSKYFHCWGWATWRRVWLSYRADTNTNNGAISKNDLKDASDGSQLFVIYWIQILKHLQSGKIDSWAYPFLLDSLKQKGLHIHPAKNLVENIGFGNEATHTKNQASANNRRCELQFPLKEPPEGLRNIEADKDAEHHHFKIRPLRVLLLWLRNKVR